MKVSKRDKKIITAGAVAVAIFCALKFGLFPLYDTFIEHRKEIAQKEQTREKYLKFLKVLICFHQLFLSITKNIL